MDKIHLKAPKGWINDPNGFIYYKGKYHLFYQHFPYAPCWGRMHWGHAISDDLTNWEHLDVALYPSKTDDMDGCFSGSAIEHNGKMHIFYTGVRYVDYNPDNTNCCLNDKFVSAQLEIVSEDGLNFDNLEDKRTIIEPIEDAKIGDKNHTRDPKVWQGKDGNYYIILGTTADSKGRMIFYKSADLKTWNYAGFAVNSSPDSDYGWMWECPDYFEIDNQGVLVFSPMGTTLGNQSVCVPAQFDEKTCSMEIGGSFTYLDYGFDLYAPQSTVDKDGRRVLVAWLRMPDAMEDKSIGMMCIPRVCSMKNGHICYTPHPNVKSKFSKPIASPPDGPYMLCTRLKNGESINVGGYIIGREDDRIFTDRSAVINGHTDIQVRFEAPAVSGECALEIFVDKNIIEVYAGDGEYVITNAVYGLDGNIDADTSSEILIYGMEE